MAKPVTLKDVAQRADVSYQTVSKVIRNQMQVSSEVRARIQRAVEELDYHPNAAAQSLRLQSSHLIGYSWVQERQNKSSPVMEEFQHSIVDSAEEFGYHILLFPQRSSQPQAAVYEELVRARRVDGFILSSVEYNDPRIIDIERLNVPVVSFGQAGEMQTAPWVDVDGRAGVNAAVQHLIEQGHQRIAILAWPESSRVGTERLAGYWDAMSAADLPIDPRWVVRGRGEMDYGYEGALRLFELAQARRPTAIVTMVDTVAVGVVQAAEARGIQVGAELAVTGFDDTPLAEHIRPRLTTLRQPVWDVGRAVIRLLIAQLHDEDISPEGRQVLLAPELVVRESSLGYAPRNGTSITGERT
jgi:DNA-binding LacI/PurR family transcriptional regulator